MIGIDVGNSTVDLPTSIHLTKRYRCWQCYKCYQMLANQCTVYRYLFPVDVVSENSLSKRKSALKCQFNVSYT